MYGIIRHMFCKTLKVPSHMTNWTVLLPVFERYSPMNLLVRYRTVRAVNTQNRDKHSFTCWIKKLTLKTEKANYNESFVFSHWCYIFIFTAVLYMGRHEHRREVAIIFRDNAHLLFLNGYARDACGSNLYWVATCLIVWRNFPCLLQANSTSVVLNKWWRPCTKSRGGYP